MRPYSYGLLAVLYGSRILLILSAAKDLACLPPSVVAIFLGRVSRSLALARDEDLLSPDTVGLANSQ